LARAQRAPSFVPLAQLQRRRPHGTEHGQRDVPAAAPSLAILLAASLASGNFASSLPLSGGGGGGTFRSAASASSAGAAAAPASAVGMLAPAHGPRPAAEYTRGVRLSSERRAQRGTPALECAP